ncbi:MAG TPA: NADH-quinone oxidoreductase subunit C [Armatimonadota bacterium]
MSEETPQVEPVATTPPLSPEWQAAVGDLIVAGLTRNDHPELVTTPELLLGLLTRLRELDPPYDLLHDLCGVDRGEHLEVVYRLYQGYGPQSLVVKVQTPRSGGRLPSVTALWPLANWAEREAAEMFGLTFTGHPDPKHLLLPEGFVGYPLRKDFVIDRSDPYLAPDPLRDDPLTALGLKAEATKGSEE